MSPAHPCPAVACLSPTHPATLALWGARSEEVASALTVTANLTPRGSQWACVYLIGVDAQAREMGRQQWPVMGLSKTLCLRPSLATSAVNLRRLFQGLGSCKCERRRFSGETPGRGFYFLPSLACRALAAFVGLALFTDPTDGSMDDLGKAAESHPRLRSGPPPHLCWAPVEEGVDLF